MELKKSHITGLVFSVLILVSSLFLMETKIFFLIAGIGVIVGIAPFIFTIIHETKIEAEKEEMFLEFARNLVESVKTGTPISKSILNIKNKPYGALSPHINKLANQISMGIPLNAALIVFSQDVNNETISRAITLIGQAERAGGDIGEILEAVAGAVTMSDKIKKERKASISTLVVQGYIIFFVFMVIVLVMQFKILPMVSSIADIGVSGFGGIGGGEKISKEEIANSFMYLLLIQGLFSGLTIGKLSEGHIKSGLKHSFTLVFFAFIISAGANVLMS
jgi:archaeal flagellar protein FlaJ